MMTKVRWGILAAIAVTDVFVVKNSALSFVVFLLPIVFVTLHSCKLFGKKHTAVMFATIILVSFAAEYIGVHTGKLFGLYYYNPSSTVNGFLWGGVPPLVTFSYISMGYVCYVIARIIFNAHGKIKGAPLVGVPVLAAMLMTIWDMSFDPIASYVHKIYTWYAGGAYFGVPFRNFTGWFIESIVFFGLITLYLNIFAKAKDFMKKPGRLFLAEVIVLMAANAFGTISKEFHNPTATQQAMALVALFGMGIPLFIASIRLMQQRS
jgi:putative membrane protein